MYDLPVDGRGGSSRSGERNVDEALIARAAIAGGVLLSYGLPSEAAPVGRASLGSSQRADDSASALVELAGHPLAVSPRTAPAGGAKVNLRGAAARSERADLAAVRNEFRRWLRANAPAARITSEHDIAVHAVGVQLNGTPLATIAAAPMVTHAELQQVFTPVAHDDPDLSLVNANEAWTAVGGEANAGAGVKVAIIDSGIDHTHPCFDDTGYPAQTQLGDTGLTNNKVIVAKVFSNRIRQDAPDPTAVNGHGTHVAGTVACNAHTPMPSSTVSRSPTTRPASPPGRCWETTTCSPVRPVRRAPRTSSTPSTRRTPTGWTLPT